MTPGVDWRAIESAFVRLAQDAVGLEAVWGNSNGPQPDRAYVWFSWLSVGQVDYSGIEEEYDAANSTVVRNYYASRTAKLDVQVVAADTRAGDHALSIADALVVAIDEGTVADTWLVPLDVGVGDIGDIRILDAVEDGARVVSRATFQLGLNIAANVTAAETTSTIDNVAMTGDISSITGALSATRL